jgi:Zn-finger nucleic acid-binding protein
MAAYRASFLRCPRCGTELEQAGAGAGCRACRGVWVGEPALDEMLRTMHQQPIGPRFAPRAPDGRPSPACPACGRPLVAVVLEGESIDRCAAGHGLWFDVTELEHALRAAAALDADADAGSGAVPDVRIGFWRGVLGSVGELLRLFGYGAVGVVTGVALSPVVHAAEVAGAVVAGVDKLRK